MKKIILLAVSLMLILSLSACEKNENRIIENKPLVTMILDKEGLGDQSSNDLSWAGCEEAKKKYDIDIRCIESSSESEYEENIEMAANEGAMLIICSDKSMEKDVISVASKYPSIRFVLIGGNVDLENVTNMNFEEEEGAFLAGVAAAMRTETNKVGIIGGNPLDMEKYEYGFLAGVKSIKPEIQVEKAYVENTEKEEEGKNVAKEMLSKNVDIIYQAAGKAGVGVIEEVSQEKKWVIGSDKDQSFLASKNVLCSITKGLDNGVFKEIERAFKNKKISKEVTYTVENKGIGISDNAGNLNSEEEKTLKKFQKAIGKGKITVPYNKETFDAFKVSEI